MENIINFLSQNSTDIVWNVFIAIISAWFAVRISLRKFSTQKWWERREKTYAEIIGILSSLLVTLGYKEGDILRVKKLSDQEKNRLFTKSKDDQEKIELVAREGAFRISEKSTDALHALIKSLNKYGKYPMEDIEIHWEAVSECRKIIISEAKKDLGIEKWYKFW